jgi:large subunit ribosomal protein L24
MKTTQPRKQRKMLHQAPLHIRYKKFSSPLSDSLKNSHNIGSLPVRSGDTVRIMRGDRKGSEGKVTRVDRRNYRIFVEGVTREKVDGTTTFVSIHPSKVMITKLNLDDRWRQESLKVVATSAETEKRTTEPKEQVRKRRTRKTPAKKARRVEEDKAEEKREESGSG